MKKYLFISSAMLGTGFLLAQTPNGGLYNNGARIVVSSGTYLYIDGDNNGDYYNKDAGATDGLIKVDGTLIVEGDFISDANTSPIDNPSAAGGTVEFRGTDATTEIGSSHATATPFNFSKLIFNKTSGGYTLLDDAIAKGTVSFAGPGIVTTGSNMFVMESTEATDLSGTFTGADRFIFGTMRRYITSAEIDEYFMPIGSSTATNRYHPAGLVSNSLTGVSYITSTVGHTAKSGNNEDADFTQKYNGIDPIIGSAESAGSLGNILEWNIASNAAPSGGTYDVRLYVKGTDLSTYDNKFIAMKRPDASTAVTDFIFPSSIPASGAAGRVWNSGNGYAQGRFNSFSKFTIAKSSHVLPVELVAFKGKCEDGDMHLYWATASEKDNDYFTVEKSNNGEMFYELAIVESKDEDGYSNELLSYDYFNASESASAYYRLKQTDHSGKSSTSEVIYVAGCDSELSSTVVNAYALNNTNVLVQIETPENKEYMITLMDVSGRNILAPQKVGAVRGNNTFELNPSSVSAGFYLVNVSNDQESYTHRIFLK